MDAEDDSLRHKHDTLTIQKSKFKKKKSLTDPLTAHLSLLLWGFEEESVDDGYGVGLDVLIGPGVGKTAKKKDSSH